jgi:hypothetical protein
MTELVWTKDKPTVPGWYWWRRNGDAQILEVSVGGGRNDRCRLWVRRGDEAAIRVDDLNGDWAGPLDPPKEAS